MTMQFRRADTPPQSAVLLAIVMIPLPFVLGIVLGGTVPTLLDGGPINVIIVLTLSISVILVLPFLLVLLIFTLLVFRLPSWIGGSLNYIFPPFIRL